MTLAAPCTTGFSPVDWKQVRCKNKCSDLFEIKPQKRVKVFLFLHSRYGSNIVYATDSNTTVPRADVWWWRHVSSVCRSAMRVTIRPTHLWPVAGQPFDKIIVYPAQREAEHEPHRDGGAADQRGSDRRLHARQRTHCERQRQSHSAPLTPPHDGLIGDGPLADGSIGERPLEKSAEL